jgi:hypothetical protein
MAKRTTNPRRFDPNESPIAWFGQLVVSLDLGEFQRADVAQRELARLGWTVRPRMPSGPDPDRPGPGKERRSA